MRNAVVFVVFTILLPSILSSCAPRDSQPFNLAGNVLLWHSWSDEDALVLAQVLDQVTEIAPGTSVITIYVPPEEMLERYTVATQQGVGPDLLLGSSEWVRPLVEDGVIRPVNFGNADIYQYDDTALEGVRLNAEDGNANYYGYPLSLHPEALYRNTDLTPQSPDTLDELLALAAAGQSVALVPRFRPAYWGIQAFGNGLFDIDGRFTLASSGFSEWLTWLGEMQHEPGIILNVDGTALEEMYLSERVSYFVAGSDDLRPFAQVLDIENIGVAPLPSGPSGPSGPLLPAEAVMLSTISSVEQATTAEAVAEYLTNPQQSTIFMRELGRIPANRFVEVDPRVYPILAGFAQQSKTAVVLPNALYREEFYQLGDRAYANAISGVLTPEEAVCEFGIAVIELQGYTDDEVDLPEGCVADAPGGEEVDG